MNLYIEACDIFLKMKEMSKEYVEDEMGFDDFALYYTKYYMRYCKSNYLPFTSTQNELINDINTLIIKHLSTLDGINYYDPVDENTLKKGIQFQLNRTDHKIHLH